MKKTGNGKNLIKVHISGAVNNVGVVELEEGSRIIDAIEKAGGLKEEAYTDEINLAYVLEDGVKIHIPTKEEHEKNILEASEKSVSQNYNEKYLEAGSGVSGANESVASTDGTKANGQKININTANQTELETLPGIGEATAKKIINYRNENGKFKTIEDIKQVSGIGNSKFDKIKELINV